MDAVQGLQDVVGIGDSKGCGAAGAAAPDGTMIPRASVGLAQHGGGKKTFQRDKAAQDGTEATSPCSLLNQPIDSHGSHGNHTGTSETLSPKATSRAASMGRLSPNRDCTCV